MHSVGLIVRFMLLAAVQVAACTKRKEQNIEIPDKKSKEGAQNPNAGRQGELPITLNEAELKRSFNINTANLTYKFSYLNTPKEGTVSFTNGVATLNFTGLPIGQTGDMTLDFFDAGKQVLHGEIKSLSLTAGQNRKQLVLRPIDPGTGGNGTTDLQIEVTINGNGNNGPSPNPSNGPSPNASPSPNVIVIIPSPGASPTPGGSTIGYSGQVKPIIDSKCLRCHNSGSDPDLSRFPFTSVFMPDQAEMIQKLIVMVSGQFPSMPPIGSNVEKLSAAEIDVIRNWMSQGLKP